MKNRNTDIAILVLTVAACAIPFLTQPFHMDDGFYMDMARNVKSNPLFPNDAPYIFQGLLWPDMGSHSHPPFQTYFLAAIQHFFGEGPGTEWIYHLFALAFPIIAVLSFYWICARFVERPLWPSMMLACAPLFLTMQHTLMTDVPMLAFWLGAICCFLWATQLRHKALYVLSTVFQIAAVFTSYQSVALAPLLGFYQLRRGRGKAGWISLAVAPVSIVTWYVLNCLHYQRPLWRVTAAYIQSRSALTLEVLGTKLLAILQYHGWLIIFPFFILYLLARDLKWRPLVLSLLGAIYIAQLKIPGYRWSDKTIFIIGVTAGFFVIFEMFRVAWSAFFRGRETIGFGRVEGQFLGLWFFGYFAYCLFILTEGSARYILPMIPPFLLCFFRLLEMSEVVEYRTPRRLISSAMLASGSLIISLVWGLALSRADQEFAEVYPRIAAQVSQIVDEMKSYSDGEWGFRYYLNRRGTPPLPADTSLVHGGSFIVLPKLAVPSGIPADLGSMLLLVKSMDCPVETPLRILDWQTPAGFYSTGWGLIPFSFSKQSMERVDIYQVNLMAERLPWARVETASGIRPWPGYLTLGEAPRTLAIKAKNETSLRYPWTVACPARLELQCGVSPDSYVAGSGETFEFEIRQVGGMENTLAQQRVVLQPGINKEDRGWKTVRLALMPAMAGSLEFRYRSDAKGQTGSGAFSQPLVLPAE